MIVHVYGHGREHVAVYRVELGHVLGHLFHLFAVTGTVVHRPFVHFAYISQAHIYAVDVVELRTDALQLYFVDGVQAGDVAVERFHLFDISLSIVGYAVAVVGDVTIGVEQEVRYVGKRLCSLPELYHLLRYGSHLVEIFLCSIGKLGHTGNLVGGSREFLYAVREILRVFLAHLDIRGNAGDAPGFRTRYGNTVFASHVSVDDDTASVFEVGTVFRIFRCQYGKYFFPMIFFGRTVESREYKHYYFHTHTYRKHDVSAR